MAVDDDVNDSDLALVRDLELNRDDLSRERKMEEFCKLTGKSRDTYYRTLRKSGMNKSEKLESFKNLDS